MLRRVVAPALLLALLLAAPARADLSRQCASMSGAVRRFTADHWPNATAAQSAHYGLFLPDRLDPARQLVVLVHGLDCDRVNWGGMAQCLIGCGYQVAYFTYPSDQPIADSAALFGKKMTTLRKAMPAARVSVLAYSMGGLVSRGYIEGPDYAGGIDRLIMIGPPNNGSAWSKYRIALEMQEHYYLWRHEPEWHWTWMITDGFGEAGRDLKPGSKFLRALNGRPRRDGVKYTIIAGSQHPARRITANFFDGTAHLIPRRAASWWGFRQCKSGLAREADAIRTRAGAGDGPVHISSARLSGVDDFVVLQADHATLYLSSGNSPPAAWETVRDRLSR